MTFAPENQEQVVRAFVENGAGVDWQLLRGRYLSLAGWGVLNARWVDTSGDEHRVSGAGFGFDWKYLKDAMADQHGGWFSSTVEIRPDGSYHFDFNYDDLDALSWNENEILDETWVADLRMYPRPWAEIPFWHVVKRSYTAESWAAEVSGGP